MPYFVLEIKAQKMDLGHLGNANGWLPQGHNFIFYESL